MTKILPSLMLAAFLIGSASVAVAQQKSQDTPKDAPRILNVIPQEQMDVSAKENPKKAISSVELRTVKLGRDFGQNIEILTGVNWNDRVIANTSDSLASGAMVAIRETTEKKKGK